MALLWFAVFMTVVLIFPALQRLLGAIIVILIVAYLVGPKP